MTDDRLVSADDHVRLTQDDVKRFLDPRHHGEYDAAVAEFQRTVSYSSAGKANQSQMVQFDHPAWGRVGYGDPSARLADMDADGVDAQVLFCEVSAFRYLYLMKDGWREATRAFNDAMWAFGSVDPKRLLVNFQVPIHDIDEAITEIERVAALGGRSLQLPVFPAEVGLPDYFDERYDRLWSAVQDVDLPVCFHIGLNMNLASLAQRDPTPQKCMVPPQVAMSTGEAMSMFLLTGLLERFPRLRLVYVEPGLGWIAWYLSILDDMVTRQRYSLPGNRALPSEYFHRNVHVTFIEEPDAIARLRDRIGVESIMWSSDYPHPVSSWPRSRELADAQTAGLPERERRAILSGNAARVWGI